MSDVGQIDQDTYTVGASTTGTAVSDTDLLTRAAKRAMDFCAAKGQNMQRVHTMFDGMRGYGNREVVFNFRCMAKQ
jgi:hypothetical protein